MTVRLDDDTRKYLENRRALTDQLLRTLIEALDLERLPGEIGMDSPLFGSGLGLDSVDAVAIAAAVEQEFTGVQILDSDIPTFRSVNSIVDFIMERKGLLPPERDSKKEPPQKKKTAKQKRGRNVLPGPVRAIRAEYRAIREKVGLLVYSDYAAIRVDGPDHEKFLETVAAGNLADLAVNAMLQTVVLNADGRITALLWIARDDAGYLLLSVASGAADLWNSLETGRSGFDVDIRDVTKENSIISIVGPRAQDFMVELFDEDILRLGYGDLATYPWNDTNLTVSRFGETGEFDYRILCPARLQAEIAEAFQDAGTTHGLRLCQSRVLNTLCLEMKSILPEIARLEPFFPSELDLQGTVWTRKETFRGREAVVNSMNSFQRRAVMLLAEAPVEMGWAVRLAGETVGSILASAYSFQLSKFVALAAIERDYAWPNLQFTVGESAQTAVSRSAPLFLPKSILESLNV